MSSSVTPAASARRRYWLPFLVIGLVAALAIAWTGLWFYVAARAKAEVAEWREKERRAGRSQDCASTSVGGYPFRVEMRCTGASFELDGSPTVRLALPSALAMVQVYDPRLLMSELTSPLKVSQREGRADYVVSWNVAQASVRGLPSQVQRGSLVLDALAVSAANNGANSPLFTSRRLELHGHQPENSRPDMPAMDLVLKLTGAAAAAMHPAAATPFDADVAGLLRGVDHLSPKPWPMLLREWQTRDGEFLISKARIQQDDVVAEGAGNLRLTTSGRLDGNLQVTVIGIEKVLRMFDVDLAASQGQIGATLNMLDSIMPGLGGLARQNAPALAAGLGQRTVLDGKAATTLPLRFVDGAVFVGPFQVAIVPPLF